MPSRAQILLAWDEYGDVVHCDDSALPGDDKDAIAGSLLRQCGADVGGLASAHPHHPQQQQKQQQQKQQQQQQQHLDAKRSRATTGNIRGNGGNGTSTRSDGKSPLLLGHGRQQEALLQRIRLMEFVGVKSSEDLKQLVAELNRGSSSSSSGITSTGTKIDIGGRPLSGFTLSYHDITIDSMSEASCPCLTPIDSSDDGGSIAKSKENSRPTSTNQRQMNGGTSAPKMQKGRTYKSSVRAAAAVNRCGHGTRQRRRLGTGTTTRSATGTTRSNTQQTKQQLAEFYVSKRIDADFEHGRVANTDDYRWDDGKRQALQRKLESSRDITREIDHAIKGDMLFVHQSYSRGGEQPILREELHRLGAQALAVGCASVSIRLRRRALKQWSRGVRRDIRHGQILKLRQHQALNRLVDCVKQVTRERLASACFRWCVESERRRQKEHAFSATIIQSALRSKLATKKLEQLRAEKREWARLTLQRLCRGVSARMVFRNMICQRNRLNAAHVLQCFARCWLARTMLERLKLEQQRKISAVMVQKMSRGRKGRQVALQVLDCRRRRVAAVHIQRISRGRRDRTEYKKRLASVKRNTAATILQSQVRKNRDTRYVVREKEKLDMERERVTLMFQRVYRGHQGRLTIRRIQHEILEAHRRQQSATSIQSLHRARVARQRVKAIRRKARAVMIREARQWVEMWNEDVNAWCYSNGKTGETLFNPPITGYTRVTDADGPWLLLQSGRIVSDPANFDYDSESFDDNNAKLCPEEEEEQRSSLL